MYCRPFTADLFSKMSNSGQEAGGSSRDHSRVRKRHEYIGALECLDQIVAVRSTGRTDGRNSFRLEVDTWTEQTGEGQTWFCICVGGNVEEDACVQRLTGSLAAGSKLSSSVECSCTLGLVARSPCFSRGHLEREAQLNHIQTVCSKQQPPAILMGWFSCLCALSVAQTFILGSAWLHHKSSWKTKSDFVRRTQNIKGIFLEQTHRSH